jgi:hypothetical protein
VLHLRPCTCGAEPPNQHVPPLPNHCCTSISRLCARASLHACSPQPTLLTIEWLLFALFTSDLVVKVYLRESRLAYVRVLCALLLRSASGATVSAPHCTLELAFANTTPPPPIYTCRYLLSFDGVASIASVVPILRIYSQASVGFLRVLRVYRLARKVCPDPKSPCRVCAPGSVPD